MEKPLISVIVPVYNVENYLGRCLSSICRQKYTNLEILLVNDGSTDASPQICENFAQKDARMKVFHKSNGGLSDARNYGIEHAEGEYITFVDSDDFIGEEYIAILFDAMCNTNSDISICESQKFFRIENIPPKKQKINIKEYSGYEAFKGFCYQSLPITAWGKLYKRKLFEKIRFPKDRIYEDFGTIYKLFLKANHVTYINDIQYFYFQRSDSIMGQKFTPKNMDRHFLTVEFKKYIENNCPSGINACNTRVFINYLILLRDCPLNKEYKEYRVLIKQNINNYKKNVLLNSEAGKKIRLMSLLAFGNLDVLKILGKIHKKIKEY